MKSKKSHVSHDRCIYCEKRIARTKSLRLLQSFESTFRLAPACKCIAEPRIAKREIRIQFDSLRKMHHRRLRPTSPRVTKSKNEVPPMILLIERYRSFARVERLVREFADWRP